MKNNSLILASSSIFRKELLSRLGISFDSCSPDIDESVLPNEKGEDLVERLSKSKAIAAQQIGKTGLIIGSDQTCCLDRRILGKPSGINEAVEQLISCSGKKASIYTGLALLNTESDKIQYRLSTYTVIFRSFSTREAEEYIEREQPLNCCGSLKSEGSGIALLKSCTGDDPTALIGLPLINLVEMLKYENVEIF